jgi:hypothetical protein
VAADKGELFAVEGVEHGAEGKQVASAIEYLDLGLFRRHIRDGAERRAGTGKMLIVPGLRSVVLADPIGLEEALAMLTLARPKSRTSA